MADCVIPFPGRPSFMEPQEAHAEPTAVTFTLRSEIGEQEFWLEPEHARALGHFLGQIAATGHGFKVTAVQAAILAESLRQLAETAGEDDG